MKLIWLLKDAGTEKSSTVLELIRALVDKGVTIHLVIANQPINYVKERYYYDCPNIQVEVLNETRNHKSGVGKLKDVIRKSYTMEAICQMFVSTVTGFLFWIKKKLHEKDNEFAFGEFLDAAMRGYKIRGSYDYILTTDENGLLWAEWLNKNNDYNYKIIYYCLELYWEHYLRVKRRRLALARNYLLFETAKQVLYKTKIIIIQDELRWKVLCKYTGIDSRLEKILVPISIKNYTVCNGTLLHDTFGLEKKKKIIFYPTLLSPRRGCDELIKMTKSLGEDYCTIIHGFAAVPGYVERIKKSHVLSSNVIISKSSFDYEELLIMHQDVWCLFLYYGESDNNDKYIVHSSNKLTMGLWAGKPIITVGNRMLADLCSSYNCGKSIDTWSESEFAHAVTEIEKNYALYCKNARKCYEEVFDIDLYADRIYDKLVKECE